MKIVCFKWNHTGGYKLPSLNAIGQYTAQHVNNLYRSVQKHTTIPHEFICITDDPEGIECRTIPLWDKCRELGGCYNRLYVFSSDMKELIGDRFLCIDLDCVVTGSLDELLSRDEDFIINKFYGVAKEQYYNGGLFMMDAGARSEVWDRFEQDIEGALEVMDKRKKKREILGTDQAWISHVLGRGEALFDDEEDGVMAYYKLRNSRDGVGKELPDKACMVLFAGQIDPFTCYHANRWIQQHWGGESYPQRKDYIKELNQQLKKGRLLCGYDMDLINPRSMSEKILHNKIFARPDIVEYADKAKAYELVPEEIRVPILQVVDDEKDLLLDIPVIIKPAHSSGRNLIYGTGETKGAIKRKARHALNESYGADKMEWHYSKIKKQLVVQPLLDLASPSDYKLHMIHGKVAYIQTFEKIGGKNYSSLYTPKWERMNVRNKNLVHGEVDKPKPLRYMSDMAERLSKGFDYVRIDFMLTKDDEVYFSEFTFFPHSGFMQFIPIAFDFKMGELL